MPLCSIAGFFFFLNDKAVVKNNDICLKKILYNLREI